MTEFLVALAALIPIFLAINFVARYGDLQQRATQASRYAAFQRAMQPSTAELSNAKLQDQMRARFFLQHDYLAKDGKHLKSDDSVAKIKDDEGQPALWRDLGGTALLAKPDQVTLNWLGTPMGGSAAKVAGAAMPLVGKSWDGAQVAQVELTLLNRMDQTEAKPADLKIGAATAAGGNGLGSSGSKGTRDAAAVMVPSTLLPAVVDNVISLAMSLFEPTKLELGCIKPDVVATGPSTTRLDGAPNNGACVN